jgi:hypothetical protein
LIIWVTVVVFVCAAIAVVIYRVNDQKKKLDSHELLFPAPEELKLKERVPATESRAREWAPESKPRVNAPELKQRHKHWDRKPQAPDKGIPTEHLRKFAILCAKPNVIDRCFDCDGALGYERVLIATYPNAYENGNNYIYVECQAMTCSQCRYICADEDAIKSLKTRAKGRWIDIRPWGTKLQQQPSKPNTKTPEIIRSSPKREFQWPSTHAVETTKPAHAIDFDHESDLHQLGYQISGVSRHKRWWILENEALPKLGLEEVANTIATLVKTRKRQRGGAKKYAYAIKEWEHDLSELKLHYYKRNFTWPRTD